MARFFFNIERDVHQIKMWRMQLSKRQTSKLQVDFKGAIVYLMKTFIGSSISIG